MIILFIFFFFFYFMQHMMVLEGRLHDFSILYHKLCDEQKKQLALEQKAYTVQHWTRLEIKKCMPICQPFKDDRSYRVSITPLGFFASTQSMHWRISMKKAFSNGPEVEFRLSMPDHQPLGELLSWRMVFNPS